MEQGRDAPKVKLTFASGGKKKKKKTGTKNRGGFKGIAYRGDAFAAGGEMQDFSKREKEKKNREKEIKSFLPRRGI